ncbi:MAG: hypothetical protein Q9209_007062 [Squamulea sp. 1 TL-2023]
MAPTAVDTSILDQFRRQFFQWYYIDKRSRSEVEKSFNLLFQRITETTGLVLNVSDKQWRGRLQRWQATWDARKSQDGVQITMPDDLGHLRLWYIGDQQLITFHACTPELCHSRKPAGNQDQVTQQSLVSATYPTHQQHGISGGYPGALDTGCPQGMTGSRSDLPMTSPFSTAPNEAFASWFDPEQSTFFLSQPGLPVPSLPPTQRPAGLSSEPLYAADSVASATRSPVVFPAGAPTRKLSQEESFESNVPTEGLPDYGPAAFINWDDPDLFQ